MTTPTVRGGSPTIGTDNGGSATVSATLTGTKQPQAGDKLLILHCNDYYGESTMPTPTVGGSTTGVNLVVLSDAGNPNAHVKAYFYDVAATGDLVVSVTETGSHDEEKLLVIYTLQDALSVDASAASFSSTGQVTYVFTGVTTTASDDLLILHHNSGGGSSGSSPMTPPGAPYTELYDTAIGGLAYAGGTEVLTATGATGTRTMSAVGSVSWAGVMIAIKGTSGVPVDPTTGLTPATWWPGQGPWGAEMFREDTHSPALAPQKLTLTAQTSGNNNTDLTSYASASFTPNANALLIAIVQTAKTATPIQRPTVTSTHGQAVAWALVAAHDWKTVGNAYTMSVWACVTNGSPGAGVITFDYAGVTVIGAEWSVFDVLGGPIGSLGPGAAAAFVQVVTSTPDPSNATSGSISLAPASNGSNVAVAAVGHNLNEAIDVRPGWTEIHDIISTGPSRSFETQWLPQSYDSTASASWASSGQSGLLAFELNSVASSVITVTSDLDIRWRVANIATSDLDVRWRVANIASSDLDARWRVFSVATSDLDLRWRVANAVTSDLDLRWVSRAQVTSDVDLRWRVANIVTSDLDARWRVFNVVTSEVDLRWIVRSQVTQNLDLRWLVRNVVTSDLDARWRVANVVTQDLDARWRVFNRITSDLDLRWNSAGTASSVTSDVDLRWRVSNVVTSDLDIRWAGKSQVTSDVDLRWAVRAVVTQDLAVLWRVATQVQSTLDLRWAVYGLVSADCALLWVVRQQVTSSLDLRWIVDQPPFSPTPLPADVTAALATPMVDAWLDGAVNAHLGNGITPAFITGRGRIT